MYRYSRLFAVCCKDRASRCEVESLPFQPWDRFPHIYPYMAVSFSYCNSFICFISRFRFILQSFAYFRNSFLMHISLSLLGIDSHIYSHIWLCRLIHINLFISSHVLLRFILQSHAVFQLSFSMHISLSLFLFFCLSIFVSLSFSLFLSLPYLSIYIFIYRSIFIYVQIFFFIFSLLQGSQGLQFSLTLTLSLSLSLSLTL